MYYDPGKPTTWPRGFRGVVIYFVWFILFGPAALIIACSKAIGPLIKDVATDVGSMFKDWKPPTF